MCFTLVEVRLELLEERELIVEERDRIRRMTENLEGRGRKCRWDFRLSWLLRRIIREWGERERMRSGGRRINPNQNKPPRGDGIGRAVGRTDLTIKLLNVQGLGEDKLRELEDLYFGDVKDDRVNHVILCLTETQHKMKKFRDRPDLVSFVQMREGGG